MLTAFIALMIGTAFGLAAALAASRFRFVAGMSVPFMVLLSATPLFALFPLFARIIGYNERTVWALAAMLVFFPIFVFTRSDSRRQPNPCSTWPGPSADSAAHGSDTS